jgi:hypothetical protein
MSIARGIHYRFLLLFLVKQPYPDDGLNIDLGFGQIREHQTKNS